MIVTVVDCREDLAKGFSCFLFAEVFLFQDLVEKLTTSAELGDDVEVAFLLIELKNFDDVGMVLAKIA